MPSGGGDLDEFFATFKPFNVNHYSVKIVEISGSSSFIPGSVVDITSSDILLIVQNLQHKLLI